MFAQLSNTTKALVFYAIAVALGVVAALAGASTFLYAFTPVAAVPRAAARRRARRRLRVRAAAQQDNGAEGDQEERPEDAPVEPGEPAEIAEQEDEAEAE